MSPLVVIESRWYSAPLLQQCSMYNPFTWFFWDPKSHVLSLESLKNPGRKFLEILEYLIQDVENTMVAVLFFVSLQKINNYLNHFFPMMHPKLCFKKTFQNENIIIVHNLHLPPFKKKTAWPDWGSSKFFNKLIEFKRYPFSSIHRSLPSISYQNSWESAFLVVLWHKVGLKGLKMCSSRLWHATLLQKNGGPFLKSWNHLFCDWSLRKSWSAGIQGEIWPTPPPKKKRNMHQCSFIFFRTMHCHCKHCLIHQG